MKTLRTVLFTISIMLFAAFAACMLLLYLNPDFMRRTIFFLIQKGKLICLILCGVFFLMALVISVALRKVRNEGSDEMPSYENDFDSDDIFSEIPEDLPTIKPVKESRKHNAEKNTIRKKSSVEPDATEESFSFRDCVNVGATYAVLEEPIPPGTALKCIYCGAKLSNNSKFCDKCGKKV